MGLRGIWCIGHTAGVFASFVLDEEVMSLAPLIVRHCDRFAVWGVISGLLLGVVGGIPYVLSASNAEIRTTIYAFTGKTFWMAFYLGLMLSAVFVAAAWDFERRYERKTGFKFFLQGDKLRLLSSLYCHPESTIAEKVSSVIMAFLTIAVFALFSLVMGLGVLKSFVLH